MQLHDLKPAAGSRHKTQRIGRGTGSGRGKTSGRGQKGQNARSEGFRLGFEGGQMPYAQRIPKLPGFKNPFKKVYAVVNLSKLSRFDEGTTVVLRRHHADVPQLDDRLLHWHPTEAELFGNLVAIQPISRPQLASEDQVHDMRDHQVLLFNPVLLGHGAVSFSRRHARASRHRHSASAEVRS